MSATEFLGGIHLNETLIAFFLTDPVIADIFRCVIVCVQVVDEDPLNSDDDVGDDAEEQKDFDTNDTIVCLWEKVGQ